MVTGDWGRDLAQARFLSGTERLHDHGVDSDDPMMLPEVRAARRHGYEPAPEAPLWCFLPAVWPDDARAWVRDTRIRHATVSCSGEASRRVCWSTADYAEVEADIVALLAECGLPPRPAGRLWLLRPPPGFTCLQEVLVQLTEAATRAGEEVMASAGFAAAVHRELRRLFPASA
jgi:hypothetical protein